jgi:hypothetical protein
MKSIKMIRISMQELLMTDKTLTTMSRKKNGTYTTYVHLFMHLTTANASLDFTTRSRQLTM